MLDSFGGINGHDSIAIIHLLLSTVVMHLFRLVLDGLGLAAFVVLLSEGDLWSLRPFLHPANARELLLQVGYKAGGLLRVSSDC